MTSKITLANKNLKQPPAESYVKAERIFLKDHPDLNEFWVHNRIAEDPSILGLGNVILRDRERPQPRAGRLDLLLQDQEEDRRYVVEVQLGKTDESHIIRVIEYWDIESKRYQKYNHCAVLIAEDITSRFLNVISLFNRNIPLIALQMQVLKVKDNITLVFTTVLDERETAQVDEEDSQIITDRNYWVENGTKATVAIADDLLSIVQKINPKFQLKYNKLYIGLAEDGQAKNFILFKPKKKFLKLEVGLPFSKEMQESIEAEGIDSLGYDTRWRKYKLRVTSEDLIKHREFIENLIRQSYDYRNSD